MTDLEVIKQSIDAVEKKERAILLRLREACRDLGIDNSDDYKNEASLDHIDDLSTRIFYYAQDIGTAREKRLGLLEAQVEATGATDEQLERLMSDFGIDELGELKPLHEEKFLHDLRHTLLYL